MTVTIFAKNVSQKSPAIAINTRTLIQPVTHYTTPAGKIAFVVGRVTCTGLGAALEARLLFAGVIVYRWRALGGAHLNMQHPENLVFDYANDGVQRQAPPNMYQSFKVTLGAGETIETTQSSGTNAEFNVFLEVTEVPV